MEQYLAQLAATSPVTAALVVGALWLVKRHEMKPNGGKSLVDLVQRIVREEVTIAEQRIMDRMDIKFEAMDKQMSTNRRTIHDRVNKVAEDVAELKGMMK